MPFDADEHFGKELRMKLGDYMSQQTIPVPNQLPGNERAFYVCLGWVDPFIAQKVPLAASFVSKHWPDARFVAQKAADQLGQKMWIVQVDSGGREVYEFEPAVPGIEKFKAPEPERHNVDGWGEF